MKSPFAVLLVVCGIFGLAESQVPREVRAVQAEEGPRLDGLVDEELWLKVPVATDFIQQDPDLGAPASQQTEVRFLFDGQTLFIGIICFDEQPLPWPVGPKPPPVKQG